MGYCIILYIRRVVRASIAERLGWVGLGWRVLAAVRDKERKRRGERQRKRGREQNKTERKREHTRGGSHICMHG